MQEIVRKLTISGQRRRSFDATRRYRTLYVALFGAALMPGTAVGAAVPQTWQPTADIAAVAEEYLRERTGGSGQRTSVKAGALDPRHRLPLCDSSLEAFMRRGTTVSARTIVGVRCAGSKPWTVYVPVNVFVSARVYTAGRTLPRNHLLAADDLKVDERDVSRLTAGYITDPSRLVGQRLKQQVIAGRIITPAMLEANLVVRRGQSVTLLAMNGGIQVSMSGKALINGAIGQRIRVENHSSGRIVEGIVRSPETVEILLPKTSSFFHATPKVSPQPADTQVSNNDR